MAIRFVRWGLGLSALLVVVGCGDDEDDDTTGSGGAGTTSGTGASSSTSTGGTGGTGTGGSGTGGSGGTGTGGMGTGGSPPIPTSSCVIGGTGTGSSTSATCQVGSATYPSLTAALADATCASVGLPAGTYFENVAIHRDVTIVGDGRDATAIVGDGTASVVTVAGTASVTLQNLEVLGGRAMHGGGFHVAAGATLSLSQVDVCENHADLAGGGIYALGAVSLSDTLVKNNTATGTTIARGAGIAVREGTLTADATTTIESNTATGEVARGGGVSLEAATATLTGSTVAHNTATSTSNAGTAFGGGLDCTCSGTNCDATFTLHGTLTLTGGATITTNDAEVNSPVPGGQSGGGGIAARGCNVNIGDTSVLGNEAKITAPPTTNMQGGGIAVVGGGGVFVVRARYAITNAHIDGNLVTGIGAAGPNNALNGYKPGGAGLYHFESAGPAGGTALIDLTTIDGNTVSVAAPSYAVEGGGAFVSGGAKTRFVRSSVTNNVLTNTATPGGTTGGGLSLSGTFNVELVNVTVSGNAGGGVHSGAGFLASLLRIRSSTLWDNTGNPGLTSYRGMGSNIDLANSMVDTAICLYPEPISSGHNVIGNAINCTTLGTDTLGATTLLPLANNGGVTLTQAIPAGAHPAADTGDPTGCKDTDNSMLTTDQIGQSRVGNCDAGAYERQ